MRARQHNASGSSRPTGRASSAAIATGASGQSAPPIASTPHLAGSFSTFARAHRQHQRARRAEPRHPGRRECPAGAFSAYSPTTSSSQFAPVTPVANGSPAAPLTTTANPSGTRCRPAPQRTTVCPSLAACGHGSPAVPTRCAAVRSAPPGALASPPRHSPTCCQRQLQLSRHRPAARRRRFGQLASFLPSLQHADAFRPAAAQQQLGGATPHAVARQRRPAEHLRQAKCQKRTNAGARCRTDKATTWARWWAASVAKPKSRESPMRKDVASLLR